MCLHHLQTGTVAIKPTHYSLKGSEKLRFPAIVLSNRWISPMPINVFVIEHPEGLIVIDAGETARTANKNYYPNFIYHRIVKINITAEEETAPQLQKIGIPPEKVRWLILTHLHPDHVGGLYQFPNAEVLVSRREWQNPSGAILNQWPTNLKPRLIDYQPKPFANFAESFSLTRAGDVHLVPTEGHTAGHLSVILQRDGLNYFFGGDLVFNEQQLHQEEISGISYNVPQARQTVQTVRQFVATNPTVFLPAHDPEALKRLRDKIITRL